MTGDSADVPLGDAARIAAAYAPRALRSRFHSVLALDETLGRIALGAREPMLAQIKLAWWRDNCAVLHSGGNPVLSMLATHWPGDTAPLRFLVEGWEAVAADGAVPSAAEALAAGRAHVFANCAHVPVVQVGGGTICWSLHTLAAGADDRATYDMLMRQASTTPRHRRPRALRPIRVLDGLARRAAVRGSVDLLGDRLSPLAAVRLGLFGR